MRRLGLSRLCIGAGSKGRGADGPDGDAGSEVRDSPRLGEDTDARGREVVEGTEEMDAVEVYDGCEAARD